MRSIIDELSSEIKDLQALVASIAPVNQALSGHENPVVRQYLTLRRRFDNAAFIIALYACYEKFAENLVVTSAMLASRIKPYSALPNDLVTKHLKKSAEILLRGGIGKGRYGSLNEVDFVRNLAGCLSGASPYELNAAAVSAHDANLRHDELVKMFSPVGIDCNSLHKSKAIIDWYLSFQDIDPDPVRNKEGIPLTTIQQRLEDLVESRNQVAHRGCSPDNLLGAKEMEQWIGFIEALANALYGLAVAHYLHYYYVEGNTATELSSTEGPYRDGLVLIVKTPTCCLFVGQPIFSICADGEARWGTILEVQVNNASVLSVPGMAPYESIGLLLDFPVRKTAKNYVLNQHDDLLWTPARISIPSLVQERA